MLQTFMELYILILKAGVALCSGWDSWLQIICCNFDDKDDVPLCYVHIVQTAQCQCAQPAYLPCSTGFTNSRVSRGVAVVALV